MVVLSHSLREASSAMGGGEITDCVKTIAHTRNGRLCPGRHLAEASLWLVVSSLLTVFDIEAAKDEKGQDIIPDEVYTNANTR
jgi:hypothetical protein